MTGINRLPVAEGVPVLGPSPGSKGSKRNTQRSAQRRASSATRPRTWRRAPSMAEVCCRPSSTVPYAPMFHREECSRFRGRCPAVALRRARPVSVRNTMTQPLCAIRPVTQQAGRHSSADPQAGASHARTWPANPRSIQMTGPTASLWSRCGHDTPQPPTRAIPDGTFTRTLAFYLSASTCGHRGRRPEDAPKEDR